jgi:hypothetical protein
MTGDYTKIHHNYAARRRGGISCIGGTGGAVYMTGDHAEVSYNVGADGTGGILIDEPACYFEMSGDHAKITRNQGGGGVSGGGIQLYGAGTIGVMSGANAEISGNYTSNTGGGVFVMSGATFTMKGSGAVISGNSSNGDGGVVVMNATFIMEAGEVSGNSGGLVPQIGSNGGTTIWPAGTHGMAYLYGLSGDLTWESYDADGPCVIPDNLGALLGLEGLSQTPDTVYRAVKVSQ